MVAACFYNPMIRIVFSVFIAKPLKFLAENTDRRQHTVWALGVNLEKRHGKTRGKVTDHAYFEQLRSLQRIRKI